MLSITLNTNHKIIKKFNIKFFKYTCQLYNQKNCVSSYGTAFHEGSVSPTSFELHKPGENFKAKNYVITEKTESLLEQHLKETGGQVRTRFPPEPNGLLHIGHAKAININFGYASAQNGICYLRYDDTNPEMEQDNYVLGIQEMIAWLGFQPYEVTYASDYFDQLYLWAEKLIEKDLAFVCHQPSSTDNSVVSPWRERPVEESKENFREMRNRKFKEGEATLRIKMTTEQKTIDPVIYRIKFTPHHRTKNKWCIYPTYDFAHCLCDSIQNITHSLCTSEFELRRSTYYWICNAVGVYCPVQTEFGRLNFLYTVISKRKIGSLIEAGIVKGWDDPRLYTLVALRRRGFPPEAINAFCRNFGLRKENAYIHPLHLHHYVREHLENTAPRIMCVLKPLKVIITNFPFDAPTQLDVLNVPADPSQGSHTVTFDRHIWIEATDFMEFGDKGFRRLTSTQGVGLRHTRHVIFLKQIVRNPDGDISHLEVECSHVKSAKRPKAFIHWVAEPQETEIRIYNNLFLSEKPEDATSGDFMSDVNPDSLKVMRGYVGKCSLSQFSPYQRFQFERVGFFSIDSDSTDKEVVFNQIVELKQDKGF